MLLVVGLLGLVFIGTIAYVIAGPDGLEATEEASAPPQAGGASQPVSVSSMSWPGQHVASSAGGHPGSPANATRRNVGQHSSEGGSASGVVKGLPRYSDGMLLLVAVAEYQDAEVFGLRSRVSKSTWTSPQRWE